MVAVYRMVFLVDHLVVNCGAFSNENQLKVFSVSHRIRVYRGGQNRHMGYLVALQPRCKGFMALISVLFLFLPTRQHYDFVILSTSPEFASPTDPRLSRF